MSDNYEEERQQLQEKKPKCSLDLKPMEEWVEGDTKACRPCLLPVTINWYQQELSEKGRQDLAEELDNARMTEDVVLTAKTMDSIKDKVPVDLKHRLLEFDCSTQEHAAQLEEELDQQGEVSQESSQPLPDSSDIE